MYKSIDQLKIMFRGLSASEAARVARPLFQSEQQPEDFISQLSNVLLAYAIEHRAEAGSAAHVHFHLAPEHKVEMVGEVLMIKPELKSSDAS